MPHYILKIKQGEQEAKKMAIQTIKFDDRKVLVGTPSDIMVAEIASPFVVLLQLIDLIS